MVIFDMVQAVVKPTLAGAGSLAEDPLVVWRTIPLRAVRTGRVYPLTDKRYVHPSQFVTRTARELARLLHPEAFAGETR